jgi:preprotein translocase subunit SecA
VAVATADGYPEEWDLDKMWRAFKQLFPITLKIDTVLEEAGGDKSGLTADLLTEMVQENAQEAYDRREAELTPDLMREIERRVVLSVLDRKWREHLYEMDYLREGIGLRAMAQRDPLVEYQREGYDMFNAMMDGIREESVGNLFNLQFEIQENPIVEEVGSGAQLGFGGSLPGVTTGGAPQQAPAPAAQAPAPAPAPAAPARHARPAPAPAPEPVAPPAAFGRRPGGGQPGGGQPGGGQRAGQQSGGRSRGRHAADGRGHATAAGRGQAATRGGGAHQAEPVRADVAEVTDTVPAGGGTGPQPVLPAGLEPRRPRNLQYSAPAEGGGVERHGENAINPYANVGRNDLCPCGSGRKFKRCHGGRS